MTPLQSPALVVEEVAIDELRPDPANPRRISDEELDALTRSMRQWGVVQPVLARREDRVVIGGHQRLVAARRLGLTAMPVIWLDISTEQARLLNLALNRISGSWDEQLLARLLAVRLRRGRAQGTAPLVGCPGEGRPDRGLRLRGGIGGSHPRATHAAG